MQVVMNSEFSVFAGPECNNANGVNCDRGELGGYSLVNKNVLSKSLGPQMFE